MYGVELYAAVRLAVVDEGLSHHEAGRRFGIDRRTVKKMLSYPPPPGYRLKQFAPLACRLRVGGGERPLEERPRRTHGRAGLLSRNRVGRGMTDATLRGGLRRALARWVKPHPFVIEAELPEQRSEMLLQNLLAHILAATGCLCLGCGRVDYDRGQGGVYSVGRLPDNDCAPNEIDNRQDAVQIGSSPMSKLTMPLVAALMVAGAVVLARGADAACGKVTIAEMTWASAGVAAHVEDIILKEGYGCDTEVVPGDTVRTVTSMTEKGEPDIAPEVWINYVREVVEAAVAEGRLTIAGEILSDGGEEGWWVPTYVVEQNPELTTLQEVIKRPDLFPDKEEPGKGRFYGCPRAGGARSSTATSTGPLVWTRPGSLCSTPARARGWRAPSPAPMSAVTRSSRTTGRRPRCSATTRWSSSAGWSTIPRRGRASSTRIAPTRSPTCMRNRW